MNVLTGMNRYLEEELKGAHSKECYKGSVYLFCFEVRVASAETETFAPILTNVN